MLGYWRDRGFKMLRTTNSVMVYNRELGWLGFGV